MALDQAFIFIALCAFYAGCMIHECVSIIRSRITYTYTIVTSPYPQQDATPRIDIDRIAPLDEKEYVSDDLCSICFDLLKEAKYLRTTTCGHTFCSECIREWLHKKHICPLCMHDFDSVDGGCPTPT